MIFGHTHKVTKKLWMDINYFIWILLLHFAIQLKNGKLSIEVLIINIMYDTNKEILS